MDGLRRLFAENPDELVDIGTPSDDELEELGNEIHRITNARANIRNDAIEPVRPITPNTEGAVGGAEPVTVTITEHSLSYTGMLPPLSAEGREHGANYYQGLLSPDEWELVNSTRSRLLASRPLSEPDEHMLDAIQWYLAAIQYGSIYDAGEAMQVPSLLMHRVIGAYLFGTLLGRDGIRPNIVTIVDLNKFKEPTTPEEFDEARIFLRTRLTPDEWGRVLYQRQELSARNLATDQNSRAVFEAINYLTDICDTGSIERVAQRSRLTSEQVVQQIDLLVLGGILNKPVQVVTSGDLDSAIVTNRQYYIEMLTQEQHKKIVDKREELEAKANLTADDSLLLSGIRCYQLACRLGSFNLAQRECHSLYNLGVAGAINSVRYVLFEGFLGFDLTRANRATSEPPTQQE